MATAIVLARRATVRLISERLHILSPPPEEKTIREVPLRDIERLTLIDSVAISSAALSRLLALQIPIALISTQSKYLGTFQPAGKPHGLARLAQYQASLDPAFTTSLASRLVQAKIYAQRRCLQRLASNRKTTLDDGLTWLDHMMRKAGQATDLNEIRGFEGAATARYFSLWASFLPDAFPFQHRSTRPPHNPVNACLSFTSTLLYNEIAALIHAHGLDPAIGTLHTTDNTRWSLALDLLEPFRPCFVEALTLDLFSHKILNADHFQPSHGGVYLNDDGKRRFFIQYERRLERQFMSEHYNCRTTLRDIIDRQITDYKKELEQPGTFDPFLMN